MVQFDLTSLDRMRPELVQAHDRELALHPIGCRSYNARMRARTAVAAVLITGGLVVSPTVASAAPSPNDNTDNYDWTTSPNHNTDNYDWTAAPIDDTDNYDWHAAPNDYNWT